MKKVMTIALIALGAIACHSGAKNGKNVNAAATLADTKWYLHAFRVDSVDTVLDSRDAWISFSSKPDEKTVTGNGGCNGFGGQYAVNGQELQLSKIFSTRKYCDNSATVEAPFLRNLDSVTRYEIKEGRLVLYHKDELLLLFEQ